MVDFKKLMEGMQQNVATAQPQAQPAASTAQPTTPSAPIAPARPQPAAQQGFAGPRRPREVARRVFAIEYGGSSCSFKESDDQYASTYVLTPTGAKVNRLAIVGTLAEVENVGAEEEYWKARVTDPTGGFFVYAGQYAPDAASFLSKAQTPMLVCVVGRVRVYRPEGGEPILSVKAENIAPATPQDRDRWNIETATLYCERLASLKLGADPDARRALEAYKPPEASLEDWLKLLAKPAAVVIQNTMDRVK